MDLHAAAARLKHRLKDCGVTFEGSAADVWRDFEAEVGVADPPLDRWCWVVTHLDMAEHPDSWADHAFPANWNGQVWTNGDTWEDTRRAIALWVIIPRPGQDPGDWR